MRIRSATTADAESCAAIYAPFVTGSWVSFETIAPDAAEMAARIAAACESYAWLVAAIDERIAGYAYGSQHRTRAAYRSSCDVAVYVDPAFARRGVGHALYGQLLPALKARDLHAAFAGIALPNDGSIGLHRACGFTPVGTYREVGWKLGAWRDVHWMQRVL
jgi:phosphinothricin acetyltransferase